MNEIDLTGYEEVDTIQPYEILVGDVIYHRPTSRAELVVTPETDLIQEEAYIMVENFGCLLLRRKEE